MSYAAIEPGYYEMLQPDSPWHAGAEGWSSAPEPGWGENPNLVGPPRLAVNGLGGVRAVSGLGSSPDGLGGGCGCGRAMGEDPLSANAGPSTGTLMALTALAAVLIIGGLRNK